MSSYNPQIIQMVNEILHAKFEVPFDKMKPEANLKEDLNLDSLDFVDMFVILEQKLGKTPQDVQFTLIKTLGDIYQIVSDLSNQEQNK